MREKAQRQNQWSNKKKCNYHKKKKQKKIDCDFWNLDKT
jgi:hypothetical protein